MQKKENSIKWEYWMVFLLAALPKIWMALQAIPLKTFSDEVATVASAAKLAGYDWSRVVSRAGYYGAGFYWIFAPVFRLTDNPVILYRCILVGCSVVQALIAPICYNLMLHHFHVKNKKYAFLSAIACAYVVISRATLMFNEHILVVLVWITAFFLVKIQENQDNKKKKRIYTGCLLLVMSYSLTIHTRMATLWIALALLLVVYGIFYRRFFLSKSVLVVLGAGGYAAAMKIVSLVQENLWKTEDGSDLRNASVNISFQMKWLSLRTWKAWGSIIAGQLQTVNMMTGGLVVLFLFLFFFFFIRWFSERKRKIIIQKENCYAILIFFFLCCTAMTIAAQSITWLQGASDGISHGWKSSDYGLKAYTYLRYFGVYIGPLMMCGLSMLEQYVEESQKAVIFAIPISGLLFAVWTVVILPFIYENPYTSETFTGFSFFRVGERFELRHYLLGMLWMIVVGGFIYFWIRKKLRIKMICLLTFFLIFQYCGNGYGYEVNRQKNNAQSADGGYELIKALEQTGNVPQEIYCYDGQEKTDHYLFYLYQFNLNRYQIIPVAREEVDIIPSGQVVFSNVKNNKILLKKGYQCIAIDSDEYVYVDEKYRELIMKASNFDTMTKITANIDK